MPRSPAPAAFSAAFERTMRMSRYVARVASARAERVAELEARAAQPYSRDEMRALLAGDDASLGARLRQLRERVMVSLAHRDLNGLATLDEVLATMTALADESIGAAAAAAWRASVAI